MKTIQELEQEVIEQDKQELESKAKGWLREINVEVERRKEWINTRENQIIALCDLKPILVKLLNAGDAKALRNFGNQIDVAKESK